MYSTIIIGAGPAGISAAIMAASDGFSVLLLEKAEVIGGRVGCAALVENTTPQDFTGEEYREKCWKKLMKFGVDVVAGVTIIGMSGTKGDFTIHCFNGTRYQGHTVLIATGLEPRELDFPIDEGCIVSCTPQLLEVEPADIVTVIGSGNSAGQAALQYYRQNCYVLLITRESLANSMSDYLVRNIIDSRIDFITGTVTALYYRYGSTYVALAGHDGTFVTEKTHILIGGKPGDLSWLPVAKDKEGYIEVNEEMGTSVSGVFAAGDIVRGAIPGIHTAGGYGIMAITYIMRWLSMRGLKEGSNYGN